jgi:hypothetical protein
MMSKGEARDILARRIAELRQQSYDTLKARWLDQPDCEQVTAESGREYGVEIEALWDDLEKRHLRVIVSVGDRFMPPTDGFIVAPNGSFVGE